MNSGRTYKSVVREERAAATRQRIVDAAQELFIDPSQEFTLERVAAMAGVSVQTVLRAFVNREGLIHAAIGTFRALHSPVEIKSVAIEPFRSAAEAVAHLFDDYELIGDRVIRMLAEEHRITGFAEVAAVGRKMHRTWVEAAFAAALRRHPTRKRAEVLTAVVAATDVYLWKLLRRDLGLDRTAAEKIIVRLVLGALTNSKEN